MNYNYDIIVINLSSYTLEVCNYAREYYCTPMNHYTKYL